MAFLPSFVESLIVKMPQIYAPPARPSRPVPQIKKSYLINLELSINNALLLGDIIFCSVEMLSCWAVDFQIIPMLLRWIFERAIVRFSI